MIKERITVAELDWLAEFPNTPYVVIGGCWYGRGTSKTCDAHTHRTDYGICFFAVDEWDRDYPSPTFLHEYAHTIHYGHGSNWRRAFARLLEEWGYGEIPPTQLRRWSGDLKEVEAIARTGRNPRLPAASTRTYWAADLAEQGYAHRFPTKRDRDAFVRRSHTKTMAVKVARLTNWAKAWVVMHGEFCQCAATSEDSVRYCK